MDAGFLGLICAVFQDDLKQQRGRVEITAFQSVPGGRGREGGRALMMDLDDGFIRIDDEDSTSYVHHSIGLESTGVETGTVRKGIPIALVPSAGGDGGREGGKGAGGNDGPTTDAMRCVVSLQEVLMQEERYFYEAAAQANLRNNAISTSTSTSTSTSISTSTSSCSRAGDVHALYNAAVYGKALSSLLEESAIPLIHTLESVLLNVRREKERVKRAVEKMEEHSRSSVSVAAGSMEGVMSVKEGGRKGRRGNGMMDVDEYQPSASPYSSSVLAVSRPEILKKAAEGWQMRRMDGNEDYDVIVRLTREYALLPFGGEGFGQWWLSVGEEKGRLTRIEGNRNGNHTVTFGFVVARPGERDSRGEKEKETIVQVLGSQDSVTFWCRRVRPIVSSDANLLPPS